MSDRQERCAELQSYIEQEAGFAEAAASFVAAPESPVATLRRLQGALRRERARGRCGHWTYDLARHLALAQDVRRAETRVRTISFPATANAGQASA